jgi:hypothetical protein
MPNWCENIIVMRREDADKYSDLLDDVVKFFEEKRLTTPGSRPFSFTWFVPVPDDFNSYTDDKAYKWLMRYWGTKWDASDPVVRVTPNEVRITFTSAWRQPTPVVSALMSKFPNLRITHYYGEGGMDFAGETLSSRGKVEEKQYAYSESIFAANPLL